MNATEVLCPICDGTGCEERLMHPLMLSADDQKCRQPCLICEGEGRLPVASLEVFEAE